MKKKVALFACGWSVDYVCGLMQGIEKAANEHGIDIYMFLNYASYGEPPKSLVAETGIFRLPKLCNFDGAIILGNILNCSNENEYLQEQIAKYQTPALYLQYQHPDIPNLRTDNCSGMQELMEHILGEHHPSFPVFMSGPPNHQESNLRKDIFTDICQKYHYSLTEQNYLQGDWTEATADALIREMIPKYETVPDAIICANDNMAFGVINALQDEGYMVPDQVLVTGYDSLSDGLYTIPSLTSVSCNEVALGEKAIELIDELINGKQIPKETILNSSIEIRQSCGCTFEPTPEIKKMFRSSTIPNLRTIQLNTDMFFRSLYLSLREVEDVVWLHYSLKYFYSIHNPIEGKDIMICLQPDFDKFEETTSSEYSDHPNVIYSSLHGETNYYLDYDIFRNLGEMANREAKSLFFTFLPIQNNGSPLGYAVMPWNNRLLQNHYLYIWEKHFAQNLDIVKHNLKIYSLNEELKRLSYTDALTGVYNRTGCDDLAASMIESKAKENLSCAVIMADLDGMKIINDQFGHTQGDLALRILALTLKQCCPKDYIISRFGGDEFLIIGPCTSEKNLELLIHEIEHTLFLKVQKAVLPYNLTCSIGGFLKKPEDKLSFEQCIERADSVMYQIKKEHHKRP